MLFPSMYGYPRATVDLDFLVDRSDLPKIDRIMRDMGYELRYRSDDVSQFVSKEILLGEVDFIHAFRKASKRMLEQAEEIFLSSKGPKVKVLRVEDVIGLKVQAIATNAPKRTSQDVADIQKLVEANYESIDWELLEEYVSLFQMQDLFAGLKENDGKVE